MKCLLIAIASLSSLSFSSALVHFTTLETSDKGCKVNGTDLAVGDTVQDTKTCGIIVCQNKKGEAFIHYCQRPVTFAECPETAVVTTIDFPQCCWTCASWGKCDQNNSTQASSRSGEGGARVDGIGEDGDGEGSDGEGSDGEGSDGEGSDGKGGDGEEGIGKEGTKISKTHRLFASKLKTPVDPSGRSAGKGGAGKGGGGAGEAQTKNNTSKTLQLFASKLKEPVETSGSKELAKTKIDDGNPNIPQERTINNSREDLRTNP